MSAGVESLGITFNVDESILNDIHPGPEQLNFDLVLSGTETKSGSLGVSLIYDEESKWDTSSRNPVKERQSKTDLITRKRSASQPVNQGISQVSKKVAKINSSVLPNKNTYSGLTAKPVFTKAELYHCELCPFTHANKANMNSHFKMKHDENAPRFNCTMCNYAPKIKQDLKKHYMKVHCLTPEVAKAAVAIL